MNTTTTVQAKPWWKSKTVIINVLIMLATMLGALQGMLVSLPFDLPGGVATVLGVLIAAVNFVLRFVTDKPVAASEKLVQVKS